MKTVWVAGLTIRPYMDADREAVARITKEAWEGATMAQLREERFGLIAGRSWRDHKTASILGLCDSAPERVVVAEREDHVVGYASFSVTHDGAVGVVGNNAVEPAWRGRGIGGALIRHVIDELESWGVQALEVSTLDQDVPAQRVYERCGFTLIAKTRHYVRLPTALPGP